MTLKQTGFQLLAFIGGCALVVGLTALGITNPIYIWASGIATGYAIIWAGVL